MSDHPRNRIRGVLAYASLAALLAVASLTLSHCTQVGDNLTGVELSKHKPVSCKKQCDKDYHKLKKQESALHKMLKKACEKNKACLDAEQARHYAVRLALEAQRQACKKNCHKQGAGSAG